MCVVDLLMELTQRAPAELRTLFDDLTMAVITEPREDHLGLGVVQECPCPLDPCLVGQLRH